MLSPYCTALSADVPGPVAGEPTVVDSGRNWLTLSWPKPEVRGGAPVLAYRVEAWPLGGDGGARWIEVRVTILPVPNVDMRICACVWSHAALIAWHCTCSADFVYYQVYNLRKQDVCVCVGGGAVSKLKVTAVSNYLSQHTHTHIPKHPAPNFPFSFNLSVLGLTCMTILWPTPYNVTKKFTYVWHTVTIVLGESGLSVNLAARLYRMICCNRIIKCARRERIQRRGGMAPFILSFGIRRGEWSASRPRRCTFRWRCPQWISDSPSDLQLSSRPVQMPLEYYIVWFCSWQMGICPTNNFDAFNLKAGTQYKFRVTPRNRYGWGESVTTTTAIAVGCKVELPEFTRILPGQLKALQGSSISLECEVTGSASRCCLRSTDYSTRTHARAHTHTRARARTHTHTHTHTHAQHFLFKRELLWVWGKAWENLQLFYTKLYLCNAAGH